MNTTGGKFFIILAATALVVLWVVYHSLSKNDFNPGVIHKDLIEVSDDENGFYIIRYLDDNYELDSLDIEGEDSEFIRAAIKREQWSAYKAWSIINKNKKLLSDVKVTVQKPLFKLNEPREFDESLPHANFVIAWRILLLKAKTEIHDGKYDEAITDVALNMQFCEKIRSDENGALISYFIGSLCIAESIDIFHELITFSSLKRRHLVAIYNAINLLKNYEDDSFSKSFSGEFYNLKSMLEGEDGITTSDDINSFTKQWFDKKTYGSDADWKQNTIDKIYKSLILILPSYYLDSNKLLNNISLDYVSARNNADKSCAEINFEYTQQKYSDIWSSHRTVLDILKPGSLTDLLTEMYAIDDWYNYQKRRCHYHNYFQSMKVFVATQLYQMDRHAQITHISQLVPDYISEVPEDYFGNGKIGFSPKNKWLYSVGTNHMDEGGSTRGFYNGRCYPNEDGFPDCDTNPTVPFEWGNYKIYEYLNPALAGDAKSQRKLGHLYSDGKYINKNYEEAFKWYMKAAEQGDVNAISSIGWAYHYGRGVTADLVKAKKWYEMAATRGNAYSNNNLGMLYDPYYTLPDKTIKDIEKAKNYYKIASMKGSEDGKKNYARLLMNPDDREFDLEKGLGLYRELIVSGQSGSLDFRWALYDVENKFGIPTSFTIIPWYKYFLNNYNLAKEFDNDSVEGYTELNNDLANHFNEHRQGSLYDDGSSYQRYKNLAIEYYTQSENTEKIKAIENDSDKRKKWFSNQIIKNIPSACDLIFKNSVAEYEKHKKTQYMIYADMKHSKEISSKFRQEINGYYKKALGDGNNLNETISFSFHSISLSQLFQILYDFGESDYREYQIEFDKNLKNQRIVIQVENEYYPLIFNLLLREFNVNTTCKDGIIYLSKKNLEPPRFYTSSFVTTYNGFKLSNNLFHGRGELIYDNGAIYAGDLIDGLASGTGLYTHNQSRIKGSFQNGMINGFATYSGENGEIYFEGQFVNGILNGTGRQGLGYDFSGASIYEGNFLDGARSGKGTITYVYADKYSKWYNIPVNFDYKKHWSFTGEFFENHETVGECTLYGDDQRVLDRFSCEFHKGYITKIGTVDLLPPDTDFDSYF